MDHLTVHSIELYGRHGVHAGERVLGQQFIVTLTLELDTRVAASRDDLTATVDYTQLIEHAREVVEGESYHLIETLAEHIAAKIGAIYTTVRVVTV
ncbi:MAG TPA: dihydroneopterin aldolase, partial [Opitutaceae bacterium]|nr:dihydroneopterin aldolase [Opitutaceae bacterium]